MMACCRRKNPKGLHKAQPSMQAAPGLHGCDRGSCCDNPVSRFSSHAEAFSYAISTNHCQPLCQTASMGVLQAGAGVCGAQVGATQSAWSHHSFKAGGTCVANLVLCRLDAGRCQRGAVCRAAPEHLQQPWRHHALQGFPLLLAPQLQHCMGQGALLRDEDTLTSYIHAWGWPERIGSPTWIE